MIESVSHGVDCWCDCLQTHGRMGVCEDTILPFFWKRMRTLRLTDRPDQVHMRTVNNSFVDVRNTWNVVSK